MTLDTTVSTVVVAVLVVLVSLWGIWFSRGSAQRGPAWALAQLERWRPAPWVAALLGGVALVVVDPVWLGIAVLYVAAVTGWLTRTVRLRLDSFRRSYGEFDPPPA